MPKPCLKSTSIRSETAERSNPEINLTSISNTQLLNVKNISLIFDSLNSPKRFKWSPLTRSHLKQLLGAFIVCLLHVIEHIDVVSSLAESRGTSQCRFRCHISPSKELRSTPTPDCANGLKPRHLDHETNAFLVRGNAGSVTGRLLLAA